MPLKPRRVYLAPDGRQYLVQPPPPVSSVRWHLTFYPDRPPRGHDIPDQACLFMCVQYDGRITRVVRRFDWDTESERREIAAWDSIPLMERGLCPVQPKIESQETGWTEDDLKDTGLVVPAEEFDDEEDEQDD